MKMARPARERVRQLVAVWLGWVLWCSAGGARAQVEAELERALTVTRELPGCVSASALRARTAQYLGHTEQLPLLNIEVDLRVPHFRVLREGTVLAERRFSRAPTDCSERRDVIALAVAIAIEQVAENSAAQGAVDPPPAATRASATAATRDTTPPTAATPTPAATQPSATAPGSQTGGAEQPTASPPTRATTQPLAANTDPQPAARLTTDRRTGSGRASAEGSLPADEGTAAANELTGSRRPGTLVSLLGGAAVLFQALPTAAAAFSAGAELAVLPAVRIGLSGLFSLPVSSAFEGGSVSTQLFGAQLTGCGNAPVFASLLVHGCAGAIGGVIQARGDDFALNLSDQMGWLAGLVRARLEFPAAGHVAASVYADGRVNLLRPELQAGLAGEPARTQAVGLFGAALGVELIVRLH